MGNYCTRRLRFCCPSSEPKADVGRQHEEEADNHNPPLVPPVPPVKVLELPEVRDAGQLSPFIEYMEALLSAIERINYPASLSAVEFFSTAFSIYQIVHEFTNGLFLQKSLDQSKSKSEASEFMKAHIGFAGETLEKISAQGEALYKGTEKLAGSVLPQEAIQVVKDVMKGLGHLHWIAIGFSVVAFVLERMEQVSSNVDRCIALLKRIMDLAKILQTLHETMSTDHETLNNAVFVIVEGAIICCRCVQQTKMFSYLSAATAEASLSGTCRKLDELTSTLNLKVSTSIQSQLPFREQPSQKEILQTVPVGIEEAAREVTKLLEMENGIGPARAVILYGFGGVGKTTLAEYVVSRLNLSGLKLCVVRVHEENLKIKELQMQILTDMGEKKIDLRDSEEGRAKLKAVLKKEVGFLFIDNVDKSQIKDLLPETLSLPSRSRVLITSRKRDVRQELGMECKSDYLVGGLSAGAARELLHNTLLLTNSNETSVNRQAKIDAIADACGGIPLLLKVYGKYLRDDMSESAFQRALDSLNKGERGAFKEENLSEILLDVYHNMKDENTKDAFLDICAFFHGWQRELVVSIVGETEFRELEMGALLTVNKSNEVIIHDVLRQMGNNEAQGTRLKTPEDLSKKSMELEATELNKIKGIWLVDNKSLFEFESEYIKAICKCKSLRVLALGDRIKLCGRFDRTFENLRYVQVGDLQHFPFKDRLKLEKITVLHDKSMGGVDVLNLPNLQELKLTAPSGGTSDEISIKWRNVKKLTKLQRLEFREFKLLEYIPVDVLPPSLVNLDLSGCEQLLNLPQGIRCLTALKKLSLKGCKGLNVLSQEFARLHSLQYLSMEDCENLSELPVGFGCLTSLVDLTLDGCKKLKFLPQDFGQLRSLKRLSMINCENLRALPPEFGMLSSLTELILAKCKSLQTVPEEIGQLSSLKHLIMRRCHELVELPEGLGYLSSLESLNLHCCYNLKRLPENLGKLVRLQEFRIRWCTNLERLPLSFGNLSLLQSLDLTCLGKLEELPESIGKLSKMKDLQLGHCSDLPRIPCGFGELDSLETLDVSRCNELVVLPMEFGQLKSLKKLVVSHCRKFREFPQGFGQDLPLQVLELTDCSSLLSLPDTLCNLKVLTALNISNCTSLTSLSDGFGSLACLKFLRLSSCHKLKTVSDDLECLTSLRNLAMTDCPMLEAVTMERVVKLKTLVWAAIVGSVKLEAKWEEMQREAEYPLVVYTSRQQPYTSEELHWRAASMEFFNGQCEVVDRNGQSMLSSNLTNPAFTFIINRNIQGLQKEQFQTVINDQPPEKLPIVYIEVGSGYAGDPVKDEESITQHLGLLPDGALAISASHIKARLLLSLAIAIYDWGMKDTIITDVKLDEKGRKCLVPRLDVPSEEPTLTPYAEDDISEEENEFEDLENTLDGISFQAKDISDDPVSQSISPPTEAVSEDRRNKMRQFTEVCGIEFFIANDGSEVKVEALEGKVVAIFVCNLNSLEFLKLEQIYDDLQHKCSNAELVWAPIRTELSYGFGSYFRATRRMPWLTLPDPYALSNFNEERRVVVLDEKERIMRKDATELVLRWGADAFPFTEEKIEQLRMKELVDMQRQSCLEFLFRENNYDAKSDVITVEKAALLQGKIILVYGSRYVDLEFQSKVSCMYRKLKDDMQVEMFEVVYVGDASYEYLQREKEMNNDKRNTGVRLSLAEMIRLWCRCLWVTETQVMVDDPICLNLLSLVNDPDWLNLKRLADHPKWLNLKSLADHLVINCIKGKGRAWSILLDENGEVVTGKAADLVELLSESNGSDDEDETTMGREVISCLKVGRCNEIMKRRFSDEMVHPLHPQHPLTVRNEERGGYMACDVCRNSVARRTLKVNRVYRCYICRWNWCGKCRKDLGQEPSKEVGEQYK